MTTLATSSSIARAEEDDAVLEQAREDVPAALAAVGLLDDRRNPHGAGYFLSLRLLLRGDQHLVDDAVLLGLRRRHEVVALGIVLDLVDGLTGVLRVQLVERVARLQDLARVDVDVGRLTLKAGERLVDHHARVRQRVALALRAGGEQEAAHRRRLAHADRRDVAVQVLHRVVDREARRDVTAGRVDVQHDVLLRLFGVEEQELGDHDVRDVVVDRQCRGTRCGP